MSDGHKQPTEFDAYADKYEDLIRDPLREKFTASNRFFFERKLQVIQDFFARRAVHTRDLEWLDVGCGRGDLLKVAHPFFKSSTGCDPSEGMLQSCAEFQVRHQKSDSALPFADCSFDFITAVCVYHHVPQSDRLPLTMEIRRLLRPNGVMCIIEHNPLNPVTKLIVSRSPVDADAHLLRLSRAERLLAAAGTTVLGHTYFLLFPPSIHTRFAAVERGLSAIPLGGQYAVFSKKG